MCVVTVYCTGKIYSTLKTIRAWNHRLTVPIYFAFALATGSALLMAIATVFNRFQIFQLVLAMLALLTLFLLKFSYWYSLDRQPRTHTLADATGLPGEVRQWEVPHTATNFIMKEMGFVVARNHALQLRKLFLTMLVATGMLYVACLGAHWVSLVAAPLLLAAAWLERWLFFAEAEHVASLYYSG
jgi:DMSO reductase anchor subunit